MRDAQPLTVDLLEEELCRHLDDPRTLRDLAEAARPADVADVFNRLETDERCAVFRALTPEFASDVLAEVSPDVTRDLLESLSPAEAGHLLDLMPMDDVAEILTEDVPEMQQQLLQVMRAPDAAEVRDLLAYPPKSAGRIMTEKFVRVDPRMTAAEAVAQLRVVDEEVETITDFYSLDAAGRLQGVVSLREVMVAQPETPLGRIIRTDVISVTPDTDQEEVARLVSRYDFLALPVVSSQGVMLGLVTVDDVIDVLLEEGSEDVLRFGGIEAGGMPAQPYFSIPLTSAVRRRAGWLLLLFVAETATGIVLRVFDDELSRMVALTFFIPLLIGTGGNTGAQTVSTLIRGLALREIQLRDTWRVLARELAGGLLLGLTLGVGAFGRALLWNSSMRLSVVVGLSVVVICTWANTIGALIPLVAQRFKIDPALVSAPLITTLVDATGLAIYLLIAKSLLGL
ncbi:MAG TPA: magnesium transporter [Actinomycetota bacterium]|nr:magnesium transporter [Actinomycetota bacterium]